ncbi:hypothetical protein [Actinoalloteichus hymeniacidonis]|uniref:Uncharacterized protein n=1 Tax=Actinoalloteichus hymeniacidonis TaxID=340345 RepID=A0AAC9HLK0_9PSEU|nr:hypothetical protein [Actinoalloteichus hymeniacidonis]AOS61338.1 hypothetical protein TL08_02500 [Actinoalloteichus hymeniacidonis]MBB5910657.1 hypothetical protein [Actinoalloteichus hymeniacidonis]
MSDEVEVAVDELHNYAGSLEGLQGGIDAIRNYMYEQGCNKDGFTGLLTLLHPAVDLVGDLFNETLNFGQDRLSGTAEGIQRNAETYSEAEAKIEGLFSQILSTISNVRDGVESGVAAVPQPVMEAGGQAWNSHVENSAARRNGGAA